MHIIKANMKKICFGAGSQIHFSVSDTQVYSIPTLCRPFAIGTKDSSTSKMMKCFNILSLSLKYEPSLLSMVHNDLAFLYLTFLCFLSVRLIYSGSFLSALLKPQYWFPSYHSIPVSILYFAFLFVPVFCTKCEFHRRTLSPLVCYTMSTRPRTGV